MAKIKSSSSIKKRFKVSASGLLMHYQAGRNHLLEKKTQKRKKRLAKTISTTRTVIKVLKQKLNY
uniref:Large ribosomal subunit protein bL35c n=1 Tax=Galaxaura rugosa TaxID=268570 RepID=A0A1G4NT26_9FLOR|nr:Ribosomal protein L35 [Galaxaura rugosa]SCW21775.1 Ribosomal protein L35 [Galaxaura rugosa]